MRREDTVVGPLPGFGGGITATGFDTQETRLEGPRGAVVPSVPTAPRGFMSQPSGPPPAPASRRTVPLPAPAIDDRALTHALSSLESELPAPSTKAAKVAAAAPAPAATPARRGQIIVLFGCRGGAGATTLAVNVGAALARGNQNVCLLDLDLQLGDVFVALDLEPTTSIAALAREAGMIDGPALRRRLVRHDAGVYALGQTGRIDDVDPQLGERMPALLATLVDHFDHVVVDGVRDFGDYALAALDMADTVALVLTQDVASVRRAARAVALFRKLGYSDRKIQLVLNRHSQKPSVPDAEIERALGLPVGSRVRNDYARATEAQNQGALLGDVARGTPLLRDIEELATRLAGAGGAGRATTDKGQKPAGSVLGRLFKRSA